jgi:hypothetical protein
MGRRRVLAGDYLAINNRLLSPVISLDVLSTNTLNLILKKNWHSAGQVNSILLRVAETSSLTALKKRLSINLDLSEDDRTVADSSDGLAGLVELLNDLDRGLIVDEIEHGAVATGVEDGVKLGSLAKELLERSGLLPDLLLLVEELYRLLITLEHLNGGLVKRRLTALGRGDDNLDVGIDKVIVGVSKFGLVLLVLVKTCDGNRTYEVPAGRVAIVHLGLAGENDENLGSHFGYWYMYWV